MQYTCHIKFADGETAWTAPREEAAGGRTAARSAVTTIKTGNPLVLRDNRPDRPADSDGVDTILNWNYVVGVAAFPVFT